MVDWDYIQGGSINENDWFELETRPYLTNGGESVGEYADDAYERGLNEYCEYHRLIENNATEEDIYDAGFSDDYGNHYYPGQFVGYKSAKISKPSGKGKCPKCGKNTILKEGQFGKFYGCVSFPKCKGSRNFIEDEIDEN